LPHHTYAGNCCCTQTGRTSISLDWPGWRGTPKFHWNQIDSGKKAGETVAKEQGATGITSVAPHIAGQWGRGDNRLHVLRAGVGDVPAGRNFFCARLSDCKFSETLWFPQRCLPDCH
jgi:hypothetical protein